MAIIRSVERRLPDGGLGKVMPYHISLEGLERNIICRDDEDCDIMVKTIAVCSLRKNVIVIIYAVVSNHAHIAVLARSFEEARAFAEELKRMYSMHFRHKYGEAKSLKKTDVNVQLLDTDWYLRNALAYIPRNAYDNGAKNLADYKWTGFKASFRKNDRPIGLRRVSELSGRQWRKVFHTGDDLSHTSWLINETDELEPFSFCDTTFLEQAFNNDEAFFYRVLGNVNCSEMTEKLVVAPRTMKTDADFLKEVESICARWFCTNVRSLSDSQKARLLPYIYHTIKTSVAQMARALGMGRDDIRLLLGLD